MFLRENTCTHGLVQSNTCVIVCVPDATNPNKPKPIAPTAVNVMSGKNYEQEFELETQRGCERRAQIQLMLHSVMAPTLLLCLFPWHIIELFGDSLDRYICSSLWYLGHFIPIALSA